MDTLSHAAELLAPPVTVETADGWMVISKTLSTGSVVPPYRWSYAYRHHDTLADAEEDFAEIERGEFRGFQPVAIVPCLHGVPLGSKRIL